MPNTQSLLIIPTHARELAAAGATPTGKWTHGQICEHLARAIEGSLGLLAQTSTRKLPPWPARALGHFFIFRLGYVPRGVQAPEHVLPPADVTFDSAIARLEAAARVFEERSAQGNHVCRKHPIFGFDDFANWRRFHHVHARHHLGHMKVR